MPAKKKSPATATPQDRIGAGGELHQQAGGDSPALTTAHGAPVEDDNNSLRAGDRGPTLLADHALREKIFHFDHERIPERVVHARGYGAHGVFENYEALGDLTRASIFATAGKETETFVRFSTVAGNPARSTSPATCAGSRRSSTPTRGTGTSSATTSPSSSSRTR